MAQGTENRNRNATRNDKPFKNLVNKMNLGQMEIFYQFCNNPKCRKITALVLANNRTISSAEKQVFTKIARAAGIPAIMLEYPDQQSDDVMLYVISDPNGPGTKISWKNIIKFLIQRQVAHEKASNDSECANYTHLLLPKGDWRTPSQNYRFSDEIRAIPGVRHIDTDGVLFCLDCGKPIFVVEATSDGCPGTRLSDKHKSTFMTRRIAEIMGAEPVLLQHHLHDSKHAHDVYLTTYRGERMDTKRHSWLQAGIWFDSTAAKNHSCFEA